MRQSHVSGGWFLAPRGTAAGAPAGDIGPQTVKKVSVARRIRTGTLAVNGAFPTFLAPFGGYKQSGIGREFGSEGIGHYIEHKAIAL